MSISIGGKTVSEIHIPSTNFQQWKPVEYVYASGDGAYIDTGFKPNQDTKTEFSMMKTASTIQWFFGELTTGKGYSLQNSHPGYGTQWVSVPAITPVQNVKIKYTFDKNNLYVNDVLVNTLTYETFTADNSIWLFACNYASGGGADNAMRQYDTKIYDNGTLVRDFVPCVLTSSITADKDSQGTARSAGEIGMWDTVTDMFYGNAGTGTFVAG